MALRFITDGDGLLARSHQGGQKFKKSNLSWDGYIKSLDKSRIRGAL